MVVVLRLATLDRQSLWVDEGYSWKAAERAATGVVIGEGQVDSVHPPTYYLVLRGVLAVLPDDEFGLRLLSTLSSALALALLGVAAWRWFGPTAAAVATAAAGLSGFELFFAQEARVYALLGLVWLSASLSLVFALLGSRRASVVWMLLNPLLPALHYVGVLPAAMLAGLATWRLKGRGRGTPVLAAGVVLSLIACAVAAIFVVRRLGDAGGAGGAVVPVAADLWRLGAAMAVGPGAYARRFPGYGLGLDGELGWVAGAGAATLIIAFVGIMRGMKNPGHRTLVAVTAAAGVVPPLMLWLVGLVGAARVWSPKPFVGPTYLLFFWLAAGVASQRNRLGRILVFGAVVGLSLVSIAPYFSTYVKSDAREAARSLPAVLRRDEAVWAPQKRVLDYYRRDRPRTLGRVEKQHETSMLTFYSPGNPEPRAMDCSKTKVPVNRLYLFPAGPRGQSPDQPVACLRGLELLRFDGAVWCPIGQVCAGQRD